VSQVRTGFIVSPPALRSRQVRHRRTAMSRTGETGWYSPEYFWPWTE